MMMMSDFNRSRSRSILLAFALVLATSSSALPQNTSSSGGNATKPAATEGEYSTWDIGGFAGAQWFQMYEGKGIKPFQLRTRPIIGIRSTQDFGNYFGIEEAFGIGFNRLFFRPFGGSGDASVSQHD